MEPKYSKFVSSCKERFPGKYRENFFYDLIFFITVAWAFWVRLPYLGIERMWPDEALYGWYAQRLLGDPLCLFSKEIIEFHPPLFSFFLALGQWLMPGETTLRVVPLIFNVLGLMAIYFLGLRLSGRFLGLFCVLGLSFNYLYCTHAAHILIDGTLTTGLMLLALCLWRIHRRENYFKADGLVGVIGGILVLLKWSGLLAVIWIAAYYLLTLRECPFQLRLKRVALPVMMILTTTCVLFFNNKIQLGNFIPDTTALAGLYQIKPAWYYLLNLHNIFIFPHLIPLFIYGFVRLLMRRNRQDILLLLWFVIFFVGIALTAEKVLRYSLLILPVGLLIAGLGLEDILKRLLKSESRVGMGRWVCILLSIVAVVQLSPRIQKAVASGMDNTYLGFREAARRIKNLDSGDGLIVAGSLRIMRYHLGENFLEYGGRLANIPPSAREFEQMVAESSKPVIVAVDHWEATQPAWIYPLTEEKMEYLKGIGFRLEHVIQRELNIAAQGHKQKVPVVWIFSKQPR